MKLLPIVSALTQSSRQRKEEQKTSAFAALEDDIMETEEEEVPWGEEDEYMREVVEKGLKKPRKQKEEL